MSGLVSRMLKSVGALCVAAWAAGGGTAVFAGDAAPVQAAVSAPADLSGRWQGRPFELARSKSCEDGRCNLILDITRCGQGWCGVEVASDGGCAKATALKLDKGEDGGSAMVLKGSLALAEGTEPYTVEVYFRPGSMAAGDGTSELDITGDTGGEFRAFRRSFPFHASLVRAGDAACVPEKTISLLD